MWDKQTVNKGFDAADELREGEMPPSFYVVGHPEAKVSGSEKDAFVKGLSATFGGGKEKECSRPKRERLARV